MVAKPKSKQNKNPPMFSHESIIKNHADIITCGILLLTVGLAFQATSAISSLFILPQHSVNVAGSNYIEYTYGLKDSCSFFFYMLVCVVFHALIKEYVLDKVGKKLHLSKAKNSQFHESGQMLAFYIVSFLWSTDTLLKNNLLNLSSLWTGYPHTMSSMIKYLYVFQISYCLHSIPELYFQKAKREEMVSKIKFPLIYLCFLIPIYLLNFNRIGILLVFLHSISLGAYHTSRIVEIVYKEDSLTTIVSSSSNIIFLFCRALSVLLVLVTFLYGFTVNANPNSDMNDGDFNNILVRVLVVAGICTFEAYLTYAYGNDNFSQLKEFKHVISPILQNVSFLSKKVTAQKATKSKLDRRTKKKRAEKSTSDNELTEADLHTKRSLKKR